MCEGNGDDVRAPPPQRSRRAEGPASGVAEWEKAGVGRAGYPEEERSGPWVFNEGRLRGRRIGIVRCSGEMGGQQRRGEEDWRRVGGSPECECVSWGRKD